MYFDDSFCLIGVLVGQCFSRILGWSPPKESQVSNFGPKKTVGPDR